jgi:hypothetical protein
MFNSMMRRAPKSARAWAAKATAKAATPTSVEILIRMLLIGGIKCFMMNASELPITLETLSSWFDLAKKWRSY